MKSIFKNTHTYSLLQKYSNAYHNIFFMIVLCALYQTFWKFVSTVLEKLQDIYCEHLVGK